MLNCDERFLARNAIKEVIMKNYAHWKTPITNLLKVYAIEPQPAWHLGLYISAKAVELTHAEAVNMLKWFPHLRDDLVYTTKHIATRAAGTAMKLNHISDDIMLKSFNQLMNFHNTSSMNFVTLNSFRKTIHQIAFSFSKKESFDILFDNLINEAGSNKNIHIRATTMESMTKMTSLDKLNNTQLLSALDKFIVNQGHGNKFVKEYGNEGLNAVVWKGKTPEMKLQLESAIALCSNLFNLQKYMNTLNNVYTYNQESIKKYTINVLDKIHNKSFSLEDYMLNAYDAVYMSTSEEDAIVTFNVFKDELKSKHNEDITASITAAQATGKMITMVPEDMLLEPLSLILEKDFYYPPTMLGLRDEVMKMVDGITDTNNIKGVVDLCVNAAIHNNNIHGRATGLLCIQEILMFHKLSTTIIEHIVSSKFYTYKDELIENRIYSGETFVLLIKKALELGMSDYIEKELNWAPKNVVIDDPLEVLDLIGWEENVRYAIDMDYYKENNECQAKQSSIYECPAEDCYSANAESYCFAQADLI